jgi:hypothetical protein
LTEKIWTVPRWTPYGTSTDTNTGTVRGVTGNGNLPVWQPTLQHHAIKEAAEVAAVAKHAVKEDVCKGKVQLTLAKCRNGILEANQPFLIYAFRYKI